MSTKKTVILTTTDALDKATVMIGKQAHKLVNDIQIALASAAYFAVKDGNVEPLNALILVMGRGLRKTAAGDWSMKFMPVLPNSDTKTSKEKPFVFSRDTYQIKLGTSDNKNVTAEAALEYAEMAFQTMWTDLKEPPLVPEEFDIMAQLGRLAKQADNLQSKGTKIVHPELLEFVKRLATKAATSVVADEAADKELEPTEGV